MALLNLFRQFILRALLREKTRSTVAVTGMALGVAVMVAVRLANVSVTETFEAAVDSVASVFVCPAKLANPVAACQRCQCGGPAVHDGHEFAGTSPLGYEQRPDPGLHGRW